RREHAQVEPASSRHVEPTVPETESTREPERAARSVDLDALCRRPARGDANLEGTQPGGQLPDRDLRGLRREQRLDLVERRKATAHEQRAREATREPALRGGP